MKKLIWLMGNFILFLCILIMSVPFIYMVVTSLKVTYSAYDFSIGFDEFTVANYVQIFSEKDFIFYFMNSSIVAVVGTILTLIVSILSGFAFSKLRFKGKKQLFMTMLGTLIIPSTVTMLPLFIIMRTLNWIDSYYALILPIPTAVGMFIMRQAILAVPDELIESARIDGYNDLRILLYIIVPLIKPAIISLTIFTFVGAWNEFLWPLIATTDASVRTLTVGLSSLKSQYTVNYGLVMAGATLAFLPPFIIYILLQRKFVEGVTLSGVKG